MFSKNTININSDISHAGQNTTKNTFYQKEKNKK